MPSLKSCAEVFGENILRSPVGRTVWILNVHPQPSPSPKTASLTWLDLLNEKSEDRVEDVFGEMIKGIGELIRDRQFQLIDTILRTVQFDNILPNFSVALLRLTFSVRSELVEWRTALAKARRALIYQGYDADRLLTGLR